MQLRFTQYLIALRSAQQFLDTNNAVLGMINGTGARKSLDAAVDVIKGLAVAQDTADREARNGRQAEFKLREAVKRNFLRPVASIASVQLPEETALGNVRVPDFNATTMTVVTRVRSMADFVDAHDSVFADMGPSLSARMRTAADELDRAIIGKVEQRGVRVKATKGMPAAFAHARRVVGSLDALVKAQFQGDAVKIEQWRNAVRTIRHGVKGGADAGTPVTTPVAAPAITPTAPEGEKAAA